METENLKEKLIGLGVFIDNEHLDLYCHLIVEAKNNQPLNTYEKHHIIPRAYYKLTGISIDNAPDNLVMLSHFEHCLAHYYLCMCSTGKLLYKQEHAFIRMVNVKSRWDFDINDFLEKADHYNQIAADFKIHQSYIAKEKYKTKDGNIKNKHCYTNGKVKIYAYECPDGYYPTGARAGKKCSADSRRRCSEAAKKRSSNSNYVNKIKKTLHEYYKLNSGNTAGRKWINNGIEEKLIVYNDNLEFGWHLGRLHPENCVDAWKIGRAKKHQKGKGNCNEN